MARCLIGLGANIGDRAASINRAIQLLEECQIPIIARSRFQVTAPVGGSPGQHDYLNAALVVETSRSPAELLASAQHVEQQLDRVRQDRWGPRTIDIDLLLYDESCINTPKLVLPHPRMAFRRFVLEAASEVAGSMLHPSTGRTVEELLEHLNSAWNYVAVSGSHDSGQTELVADVADRCHAFRISEPVGFSTVSQTTGPSCSRELESLRRRARCLKQMTAGAIWISDFWLGEGLAMAYAYSSAEEAEAFERQWEEHAAQVVAPKLLVLVDTRQSCGGPSSSGLRRQAKRLRLPTLNLDAADPDWNREEVAAAIAAMQ